MCEAFAGAVLMPEQPFRSMFTAAQSRFGLLLDVVDEVAVSFGVTPAATTTRARKLELASKSALDDVTKEIRSRGTGRDGGGGNHYGNVVARLGRGFTRLVFEALDADAITMAGAATLLGTKVDGFAKVRDRLGDPLGAE